MESNLTGSYRVRAIHPAFADVRNLIPRKGERMEVRRHALKLRYWPDPHPVEESGRLLDLDWSWVASLPKQNIGELRIHDTIGGFNNLRVIFYVGDEAVRDPLPLIWVLQVMQKKRQDFTSHNLTTFKARKRIVTERFYKNRP